MSDDDVIYERPVKKNRLEMPKMTVVHVSVVSHET